jgi:mRNA interferase HigB
MRIIAKKTLREFWEQPQYRDAEQPLQAWYKVVEAADWATPTDIWADYGQASILAQHRICCNIAGNKYRLVVHINYPYSLYISGASGHMPHTTGLMRILCNEDHAWTFNRSRPTPTIPLSCKRSRA